MGRRFICVLLLVLGGLCLPAPDVRAQGAGLPDGFFTMNGNSLKAEAANRETHLRNVAATGVTAVRADVLWNVVENTPPTLDPSAPDGRRRTFVWGELDGFVGALAAHRLTWRPVFLNSPYWNRPLSGAVTSPPADPSLAAGVAHALLSRYGVGGTYWAEHPELAPRPVRWIEAWNEPNLSASSNGAYRYPPESYARFLRAVADGAHAVDAQSQVVVGGLFAADATTNRAMGVRDFLARVSATEPGIADAVAGVALHVFGTDPGATVATLGRTRDGMRATPFATRALHLNETGSAVKPLDGPGAEPARAAYLEAIATATAGLSGSACGIGSVAPYAWNTQEVNPLDNEHWFGIATRDGTPRASATAFARGVANARAGDQACGILPLPAAPAPPAQAAAFGERARVAISAPRPLRPDARRRLRIRLHNTNAFAVSGTLELRAGARRLVRRAVSLPAGVARTVTLTLSRRALAGPRRRTVSLRAVLRDPAGARRVVTRGATLVRR